MSTAPENEFDLEKLFLPAWAQEPSSSRQYAQYEGQEEPGADRGGDRRRGPRPRRPGGPRPGRPEGDRPPRQEGRPPRGPAGRDRGPGGERRGGPRGESRGPRERRDMRERREPPPPLPEIAVTLLPDERGVESLARQIKMAGRAYPLFEIAQMILAKPERHAVSFGVKKNPEGQIIQPLFLCALDESLWLSEDEAIAHVLNKFFGTFYQSERTATEPPKGKYTFVAQCGLSGIILGPPNYHDYQNQLRKLHGERFSRMPFEAYKSRVRIVRDEEVVKKWIDDQSYKTEYLCLNVPEPLRLGNREAVERHFRETHKDNIIKPVESHITSGTAARSLRSPQLLRLVRQSWEDQRRFPLQIATILSQQFATHGLQFFKVNKTITHVSVARPHYLDLEATPVSEGVKRIVEYVNANPKCTRRKLLEALVPAAKEPAAETPASPSQPAAEPAAPAPPSPEQTALIADLHWLIHQGHVIEFANGTLETAKKPAPRPPKPEPKTPAPEPATAAEATPPEQAPTAGQPAPAPEPMAPAAENAVPEPPALEGEPGEVVPTMPPPDGKHEFERPSDGPVENEAPAKETPPAEAGPLPQEASIAHPQ